MNQRKKSFYVIVQKVRLDLLNIVVIFPGPPIVQNTSFKDKCQLFYFYTSDFSLRESEAEIKYHVSWRDWQPEHLPSIDNKQ